jgi:hypothetical protein
VVVDFLTNDMAVATVSMAAMPAVAVQIRGWRMVAKLKCQVDKPNREGRPTGREGKRSHYQADSKNMVGHVKAETL